MEALCGQYCSFYNAVGKKQLLLLFEKYPFFRELKRKQEDEMRKALRKKQRGPSWVRRLQAWQNYLPQNHYKLLIFTASVAFGLFAYMRAAPDAIEFGSR